MTSIAKMFKIHFLANVLANHKKTACAAVLLAMLSPSIAACQEDPNAPAAETKHHKDKDKDKDKDANTSGTTQPATGAADGDTSKKDKSKDKDKSGVPGKAAHDHEASPTEVSWLITMHGVDGQPQQITAVNGLGQIKGPGTGPVPSGPAGAAPHDLRGMAILPDQSVLAVNAFMKDSRILHFGAPDANNVRAYMNDFAKQGPANPAMLHSYAIAMSPDGDVYVSNQDTNTVTRYGGFGRATPGAPLPHPESLAGFGNLPAGVFIANSQVSPVGLSAVRGMCFGPDGYLYVADRDGSRVSSYDRKTGERVKIVVSEANGLKKPIQVTFTEDGKSLFVGDDETEQVLRLDMDSGLCSVFIPRGTAGLRAPSALVVSAKWLYVGSRLTKEILRFEIATGKPDSKPYVTLPDHPEFLLHVIPPVEPDKK